MEEKQEQQERRDPVSGSDDDDAPSRKDVYVYLAILVGALLVTAVA